jgi:predicted nucleic acid-binding protein
VACFVDTNVLVYAEDIDAGDKHDIAKRLVVDLWDSGDGVLSLPVLQEFFVTVTRKLPKRLSVRAARSIVAQYLTWNVVETRGQLVLEAIDLMERRRLSFWDALIVQAALSEGCTVLLTEDLHHGQRIGDLTIRNPFSTTVTS